MIDDQDGEAVALEPTQQQAKLVLFREVEAGGRLLAFREKIVGTGLINGGLYLFRTALLRDRVASGPQSLERDIFPGLLSAGANIRVINAGQAPFIDIGTPETIRMAEDFVLNHLKDAGRRH